MREMTALFIDMHVHPAFYEPINEDPAREEMRHEVLNIHKNGTAKLEHIFNQMRCAGLDKMCLLPQDYTTREGVVPVTNEEVAYLVELAPDRFIGFASVDPMREDAAAVVDRAFGELGLRGLHLHPSRQRFYPSDARLDPIYDLCERYNRPITFDSGLSWEPRTLARYSRALEFEELAEARPNLRFCLSGFGWPWCEETAMIMAKHPNVYTDTGVLHFDCVREFYQRVFTQELALTWIDRSLRHQVMFGSNNPRFEQIRMALMLDKLGLRKSTLELIRGKNAEEFLGGID